MKESLKKLFKSLALTQYTLKNINLPQKQKFLKMQKKKKLFFIKRFFNYYLLCELQVKIENYIS